MSIRLRLTLTYSVILALTLIIFSSLLYFSQARLTLNSFRGRLAGGVSFADGRSSLPRSDRNLRLRLRGPVVYTQIRNLDGEIIEHDANLGEAELPLSQAGLQAVRRGDSWAEFVSFENERFLVHSRLVTRPDGEARIIQVAGSLIDRDQYLNTLRNILVVGSSLAVIAAFGIGWALAGLTLRPINRIRQTAQAIGAEHDFGRRVDHTGPNDEIGQLATTFNNMLAELQVAYLQIEQSLQAQQRFVADASHELRTPLTTIRGNIDLLQRRPPISAEDRADVLVDMVDESERLIRLVNDLLVLARTDARQRLRRESISIKPLLEEVCRQIQRLEPNQTLMCDELPDVTLRGDRDALKQVLLILLDNALKHTYPEATITVNTVVVDQQVAIHIRDTGPGIAPEKLPHIFERFYQVDTTRTGTSTGLGLSIAKLLVEAQDGTIAVESQVGQGSTFTVALPQA